ncbi:MAG TPA: sigma-70 family RNA polymerase sigma factor [Gemmatales bacterium]|nr:sigma-70 family RNA polymerase sigma factor [Gemmatales bacterium]HMP57966.1 sigma-70 family RNA polymerase sigma factor [Gemmatales bacterium]
MKTSQAEVAPETAQNLEDWELVRRARTGDADAFATMVRQHGGRMQAVAQRLLRSEADAQDAVQEAFLSAYRSLDQFAGTSRLGTWLHRIVVNACLMRLRSQARRPVVSMEELLPSFDDTGHHAQPVRRWEARADPVVREEIRLQVREAINQLPEPYRQVLLLRDIEEMDTEMTAAVLEVTPGAVKVRLHRARQALRAFLEPVMQDADPA